MVREKKLLHWAQDYMYGPDHIHEYDNNVDLENLWKEIKKVNKGKPDYFQYHKEIDKAAWDYDVWTGIGFLIDNIIMMNDWEKLFKRVKKKGAETLTVISDGRNIDCYAYTCSKEMALEETKKKSFKTFDNLIVRYYAFDDIKDFDLYEKIKYTDILKRKNLAKEHYR